jgi:hypothetical protein
MSTSPSAEVSQSFRSLSHHVDAPLQLALLFGDVHLVRDAISVADALHIAVLQHFLQAAQNRYARELQRSGIADIKVKVYSFSSCQ